MRPSARNWWTAAGIGLVTFHLLLQGYAIVSTWRGYPDSYGPGNLYFTIATIVGPVIGLAGFSWWSEAVVLRALSIAFFAAVMIGDGFQGLVFVSDTTGVTWWIISIVIGVGIAAYGLIRRVREARGRLLTTALVVVATGGYYGLWTLLRATAASRVRSADNAYYVNSESGRERRRALSRAPPDVHRPTGPARSSGLWTGPSAPS